MVHIITSCTLTKENIWVKSLRTKKGGTRLAFINCKRTVNDAIVLLKWLLNACICEPGDLFTLVCRPMPDRDALGACQQHQQIPTLKKASEFGLTRDLCLPPNVRVHWASSSLCNPAYNIASRNLQEVWVRFRYYPLRLHRAVQLIARAPVCKDSQQPNVKEVWCPI